jgi:hypothetical protein
MKTLSIILAVVLYSTTQLAANTNKVNITGDSNTDLGKFSIAEKASVNIDGENVRAFEVKYENSEHPITILLNEKKKCKDYIVRSKNLEIKYVCKKNSFGAKYVSGKFIKFDPIVNAYFLNEEEFKRQQILSNKELNENEALSIIASYFPQLIIDTRLLM